MFQWFGKTEIDFVGKRNVFFALSGLGVLLGFFALVQIGRGVGHLGIDFSGGVVVQLRAETPVPIDQARKALALGNLGEADFQDMVTETGHKMLIRFQESTTASPPEHVYDVLSKAFPKNGLVLESSAQIGPTIGRKLRDDALVAILLSLLGIVLYIAMRFEFRYGIAAAIATFHDVLVVLGILYLMRVEITLLIVSALLTLAGYSLSDTVVVFDRIRENLRFRRKESLDAMINKSINDVLARTLNTSITTLLAVLALFFLGGEVIHDFALVMAMGIVVGTYSSWYIASPLLLFKKKAT